MYTLELRFAKWACERLTEDCAIFPKKIIFSDEAHFDLEGYEKQAKLSHLGHTRPARINWKVDAPKTSHCLVKILLQRHNWVIFPRKWARTGRYSQWLSLSDHVEWIFVHKNWREGHWQHLVSIGRRYVPHSRSYTLCFVSRFWRSHYRPQSWCRLATSELRFYTVGLLFVGCRQR